MAWRIGVDIGGTFTDVALIDEAHGAIGVAKTPTTPEDFGRGVLNGLNDALAKYSIPPAEVTLLSHATTVVTNALLEEKGARIAHVSTRGFRDVLELRRSARADLYDLHQDPPAVLVPRHRRLEITERIAADGSVVTPLAEDEVDDLIADLRALEVEAVAVSLLFSFQNNAHEKKVGAAIRAALPDIPVFLSCEVLPEIREFERSSTTAVCAYVGPILESYLGQLQKATDSLGLPDLMVMGSAGGVLDVASVLGMPAAAVESGPAAGVIAAQLIGRQIEKPNLLSFDMGGTTAKASLIENGRVETTAEYEVGSSASQTRWLHGTGHPIRVPVIDLAEVSAGGGSIAWIDPAGALRVGPESAGAVPGPVCYGQGGEKPTVTDVNLVLGYLDNTSLLGGNMRVDFAAAENVLRTQIAEPLGQSVDQAAAGIRAIVNNAMAEALRMVSVERGHDPRDFAMIAFGGAGPLHACDLAEELDVPEVIVPPIPGAFSALGLVGANMRRDYSRTIYAPLTAVTPASLAAIWEEMETMGRDMLIQARVPAASQNILRQADLRYGRQAYELTVDVPDGPVTKDTVATLAGAFHTAHERTYGHKNEAEPVHLVTLRLSAIGNLGEPRFTEGTGTGESLKGARPAWFPATGRVDTPVHERARLAVGQEIAGPAIVESLDSTLVIPPAWQGAVDAAGFIRLTRR
ncbi:MAG: hydantoinase/oxoprolinase family protein [Pseudomonadota bacterium]|nr:hydantoinase/oxoprolinase family protein [Pseudomonadota bacterium]